MRYFYKMDFPVVLLGLCAFLIVITASPLPASTMKTYDSDGMPVDIQKIIKTSPDLFIQNMEDYLKLGKIDALGVLSSELIQVKKDNPDVKALHCIFLASKGKIAESKTILKKISKIDSNAYALYANAMILRAEADYKSALKTCEKAVAIDTLHPYPRNIMGRIYFDMGEYKKAITSFQAAVKLQPDFVPGYTNLGAVFFTIGEYESSVNSFKQATAINPGSDKTHYGLALAYEKLEQHLPAVQELEKTRVLNPENTLALKELGPLYIKIKQYEKAFETGNAMLKKGLPGSYEVLGHAALYLGNPQEAQKYLKKAEKSISIDYLMGFCLMTLDRQSEALAQMEIILKEKPDHYGAYYARAVLKFYLNQEFSIKNELHTGWGDQLDTAIFFTRGCVHASLQDWKAAQSDWTLSKGVIQGFSIDGLDEKTLSIGLKKNELRYLNMGLLYYFKNQYGPAMFEFQKALKINKKSVLSNYWAAQTLLETGKRKEATALFKTAVKTAPNFFSALYATGELSLMAGDTETAVNYYIKALRVKKDPGILVKLGLLNEQSKNLKKAAEYYEELIQHFPGLFIGYNQLAWLYARQGIELDMAMELARKADKLQPGNASVLDTIAWICFQNKEYEKAIEILKKATAIGADNPSILYHLGVVYNSLDKNDMAKIYLKKALDISTNFDEFKDAQKLFDQLK